MSGIHDKKYLCLISMTCIVSYLVSMMHIVYVGYPRFTLFMSGIHDTQYLCLDHVFVFLFCGSHTIKFSPFLISEVVETMVYLSQSRNLWQWPTYVLPQDQTAELNAKYDRDCQKVWSLCGNTRHTQAQLCIYNYIYIHYTYIMLSAIYNNINNSISVWCLILKYSK